MDSSQVIKHFNFYCLLFCMIGTTYGRSITDVKPFDDGEFDENNWVNDPRYPETDRKTFANGICFLLYLGGKRMVYSLGK